MKKIYPFILLILFSIPALLPLFHKGFFLTDDGNWMVIRFSAFYDSFRHRQFPVRFLMRLNNGYGYPVADFLYPLFMYIGVPIHVLGISFVNTIKFIFGLSLLAASIFSYSWLRRLFGKTSSFVGALMYLYFPYHLFDINNRGSIGEVVALGIVPLVLWQIERKSLIWSSIGCALLILAHNILAFLFMPLILGYLLIRKYPYTKIGVFLLISLGMSAFFWMPALYDRQFTVFSSIAVSNFTQYFLTQRNITLVGIPFILVVSQAAYFWFIRSNRMVVYFLSITCILFFFLLPTSLTAWQYSPLTPLIQFPWRLLSVILLNSAFLTAYVIENTKKYQVFLTTIYILLIGFSSLPYIYPKSYQYYPDTYYSTNQDTTTVKNEYMPIWVKHIPTQQADKIIFIQGKGNVGNLVTTQNKTSATIQALTQAKIRINTIYFPGWEVWIDGRKGNIEYKTDGFLDISIPVGYHTILARFTETPLRVICDIITILTLFVVIFWRKKIIYV